MTNKDMHGDWGICKETFDLLCTLVRLGLRFRCPMEKVIHLQVQDDELQSVTAEVYRRKRK